MSKTPPNAPHVDPSVAKVLDLSSNRHVAPMMQLVEDLSRADDPQDVLRTFGEGIRKVRPIHAYLSLSTRGLGPGQFKITRYLPGFTERELEPSDPWSNWHKLPVLSGGLLGQIVEAGAPVILHDLKLRDDPAIADMLAPYGSLMAVPLFDQGLAQNWAIQLNDGPDGFTVEELDESILRANLVGSTVRNVLVAKQLREANTWIEHEIDQIASIQKTLLPAEVPQIPGLAIATHYETFDRAGGDMFDFVNVFDGPDVTSTPWGLFIADASGHGPAAAVVAAMMHTILRTYPKRPRGPAEVLEYANRHLFAKRIADSFVTAFLAFYDPALRRLQYCRAGHPPPLLKHGDTRPVDRIESAGNVPLGVLDQVGYEDGSITLEPGQSLVLYTDGITEARDAGGGYFGVEGIESAIASCTGEPDCVVAAVVQSLHEHQGRARPDDDQTIVAVQVR